MRVLVIDDTAEVREMIGQMLSGEGYDVLEAANGKKGMQIISSDPKIDIVITDLIMPEKEGIETIREIKQDYSHIRILAISGGGKIDSQNYLAIAKGMGADLTLSKPFVKQDLLKAVQELSVEK